MNADNPSRTPWFSILTGGTYGAMAGAGLGQYLAEDKDKKIRNMLLGAAAGGTLGMGGGYLVGNRLRMDEALGIPYVLGTPGQVQGRGAIMGALVGGAGGSVGGPITAIQGAAIGGILGATSASIYKGIGDYLKVKSKVRKMKNPIDKASAYNYRLDAVLAEARDKVAGYNFNSTVPQYKRDKIAAERGSAVDAVKYQFLGNMAATGAAMAPSAGIMAMFPKFTSKDVGSGFLQHVRDDTPALKSAINSVLPDLKGKMPAVPVVNPSSLGFPQNIMRRYNPAAIMHDPKSWGESSIIIGDRFKKSPGIVAHELGHVMDSRKRFAGLQGGLAMTSIAAPIAALAGTVLGLTRDSDTSRNAVLAGTSAVTAGLMAPNLYSEYRASNLGNKVLKKMYPNARLGRTRLGNALALGTYGLGALGLAASPWVASYLQNKYNAK